MTAQIWRPSQAGHYNNGAWVMITSQGAVHLRCLHPQCVQRGYSNERLLGQIPLRLMHLISTEGELGTLGQGEWMQGQPHPVSMNCIESAGPIHSVSEQQASTPNDEATRSHGLAGSPQPRATDRETGVVPEGCELRMDTPALGTSCERQSRQLSCAQSFALIARDNQAEEEVSFQAWTVEAGS